MTPRRDRPERPSRVANAISARAAKRRAAAPAQAYRERHVPGLLRWVLSVIAATGEWAESTLVWLRREAPSGTPPVAEPGGRPVVIKGTAFPGDEKQYRLLAFDVRPGTGRLEVDYDWKPLGPSIPDNLLTQTIFDLGLWDEHGYRSAEGFRGWSGSRHKSVFLQADAAQRGYRPGAITPGTWHVDLGVAAVGPTGAEWTVRIQAKRNPEGPTAGQPTPEPDPVDPAHVARAEPGWYHGDFHMHSWHSNPHGPTPDEFVAFARAAKLDFLPVTEYVVGHHWVQYGRVQRDNPDLVIWPGREIVTYHGHVQSLGETPGFIEFRHGFEDVTIADIQREVRAHGALFGVNHPTTFPGPLFRNLCRGCEFELGDDIDWAAVDTIEVLTASALVDPKEYHLPDVGGLHIANPFSRTAIALWEKLLNEGHKITAVCGSDDKLGPNLGTCATAVYATELSRAAVIEGIRAGRAYVRTRGVAGSPALELAAVAPGQPQGAMGSIMAVDLATDVELRVTVTGGQGQTLRLVCNALDVDAVMVDADPFEHTFTVRRVAAAAEGPLGTWYRVETLDGRGRTTIANPVFLQAPASG